jgi:bifunctional non-homologous end joining protein LigD
VLLPLGGACTYAESRGLAELIARVIAGELPEVATVERVIAARGGRVYLDFLQNGHGRLLVAPFSVRPLPGAPVSMPLRWDEVVPSLDPKKFTIKTAPARLAALGEDPLRGVLEARPDLAGALARLAERIARVEAAAPAPAGKKETKGRSGGKRG